MNARLPQACSSSCLRLAAPSCSSALLQGDTDAGLSSLPAPYVSACHLAVCLLFISCLRAECLHGHQERYDGMALPTIFPQPLMLAGTFDPQLAFQVCGGSCEADTARAAAVCAYA
jgi:hypothetical protein